MNELRERVAMAIHIETTQIPERQPHECDYSAADAVIDIFGKELDLFKRRLVTSEECRDILFKCFQEQTNKLKVLLKELEDEIPGYHSNEYEVGESSGRQRAITALESILEGK
jgi:hypothetical protein